MRILVVGMGSAGGVGRYEQLLQAALGELSKSDSLEWRSVWRSEHPQYLTQADVTHPVAGQSVRQFAWTVVKTARDWRPHIIYFTHVNLARLGSVLRASGVTAPYIVGTHGVEVWSRVSAGKRLALKQATRVLAVSNYTRDRLIDVQGLPPERCETVHLALEDHWADSVGAFDWEDVGHGARPGFGLLSVCRLDRVARDKGVDWVLGALARLAPSHEGLRYTIVGDGDDRAYLQTLAGEVGIADRVTFAGELDHKALLQAYFQCDAFILPTRREGFGLVFLEAMCFRKPIIAAACAGTLDVVRNNEQGLLIEDELGLPAAIEWLMRHRVRASVMGESGHKRVMTEFSIEAYVTRLRSALAASLDTAGVTAS